MYKLFDLVHLQAFVSVAEAGGFNRAAGAAISTQPTLSRQVKALEQALGRSLFDRAGRKVILTPFGKRVLTDAQDLLRRSESLSLLGKNHQGKVSGLLHLGAADSVVLSRLPGLLRNYLLRYRGVSVHVHTASSPQILNWVREGRCDLGLCMLPESYPGLECQPVWEDSFVAIVPYKHPLANRSASLAEFAKQRLLTIEPNTLSFQVLSAAFQKAGLLLMPDMTFDTFSLIVAFVTAGVGVGIVSESVAKPALRKKQIARVKISEVDQAKRNLGIALGAGKQPDEALSAFLKMLREQAG